MIHETGEEGDSGLVEFGAAIFRTEDRRFLMCVFHRGLLGRFNVGRWGGRNLQHKWNQ